jgi:hypothetical protein
MKTGYQILLTGVFMLMTAAVFGQVKEIHGDHPIKKKEVIKHRNEHKAHKAPVKHVKYNPKAHVRETIKARELKAPAKDK